MTTLCSLKIADALGGGWSFLNKISSNFCFLLIIQFLFTWNVDMKISAAMFILSNIVEWKKRKILGDNILNCPKHRSVFCLLPNTSLSWTCAYIVWWGSSETLHVHSVQRPWPSGPFATLHPHPTSNLMRSMCLKKEYPSITSWLWIPFNKIVLIFMELDLSLWVKNANVLVFLSVPLQMDLCSWKDGV